MRLALFPVLLFISTIAFAGKVEREFKSTKAEPAVKAAIDALKKSCGCNVTFNVAWDSFNTVGKLQKVKYIADSFPDGVTKQCTDDASKAAMCKLKTIDIKMADKSDFMYSNGHATFATDGTSAFTFDKLASEVDK
jgi:hypothetical protein